MRVIFAGTPEPALASLRALLDSRHDVVGVLTRPDAKRGRGRTLHRSPVAAAAQEAGIEVLKPRSLRGEDGADVAARLRELAPDVVPVVAYGNLVPGALLDLPVHGWANLHFSLLPAWRGAAPVQHAIIGGDQITGASVFQLEQGLDTGPVYGTLTTEIGSAETAGDLLGRLAESGAQLLVSVLDSLEDETAVAQPQPLTGVSLAPKLDREDGRVRWSDPALAVDRRIRGTTPAPGAWTTLPGAREDPAPTRLKLGRVHLRPEVTDLGPGVLRTGRHEVLVGTGSHAVALGEVAPAGKSWMPAADWARGARLAHTIELGASHE